MSEVEPVEPAKPSPIFVTVDGSYRRGSRLTAGMGTACQLSVEDYLSEVYCSPIDDDLFYACKIPVKKDPNYAEIWAVIFGLSAIAVTARESRGLVTVCTDSKYVFNRLNRVTYGHEPNVQLMEFAEDLFHYMDADLKYIDHVSSKIDEAAKFMYNPNFSLPDLSPLSLAIRRAVVSLRGELQKKGL